MAEMGRYCKAYPIQSFRAYPGWSENTDNLRREKIERDGREEMVERVLAEDDYLYLQENYVVTDGIFIDENIIFGDVTPEWIEYCKETLKFEVPNYESVPPRQSEEARAAEQ